MARPKVGKTKGEFDAFVASAVDPLFRSGYLMTADVGETEDMLQETFLRVARRWHRVRSMHYPLAYARRILINLVLDDATRRSRRTAELQRPDEMSEVVDPGSLHALNGIDDESEFRWALATLQPRQRAVLILRYWDDLPEAEVAEILDCPIGTVKSSAARGVAELRRVLGRAGDLTTSTTAMESHEEKRSC